MRQKRTIQTVQKSIAAFFRENRRMPSFAEMVGLLGVRSKSVVNFWVNKLIEAAILELPPLSPSMWGQIFLDTQLLRASYSEHVTATSCKL